MERRLIVLRHAKSSWDSDVPSDHARPIDDRGVLDAAQVARDLNARGWVPQKVVSSDATRTRQTWETMSTVLGCDDAIFTELLYHAGPEAVRRALREIPGELHTLLIVGHNPGWEEVVSWLTGVRVHLTTCNAALLRSTAADWDSAMERGAWHFEELLRPPED